MKGQTSVTYYPNAVITCNCGTTMTVGSTVEDIRVEICSQCHPFFTGKQNIIDTAGRVDRFKQRASKAGSGAVRQSKTVKRAALAAKRASKKPKLDEGGDEA